MHGSPGMCAQRVRARAPGGACGTGQKRTRRDRPFQAEPPLLLRLTCFCSSLPQKQHMAWLGPCSAARPLPSVRVDTAFGGRRGRRGGGAEGWQGEGSAASQELMDTTTPPDSRVPFGVRAARGLGRARVAGCDTLRPPAPAPGRSCANRLQHPCCVSVCLMTDITGASPSG